MVLEDPIRSFHLDNTWSCLKECMKMFPLCNAINLNPKRSICKLFECEEKRSLAMQESQGWIYYGTNNNEACQPSSSESTEKTDTKTSPVTTKSPTLKPLNNSAQTLMTTSIDTTTTTDVTEPGIKTTTSRETPTYTTTTKDVTEPGIETTTSRETSSYTTITTDTSGSGSGSGTPSEAPTTTGTVTTTKDDIVTPKEVECDWFEKGIKTNYFREGTQVASTEECKNHCYALKERSNSNIGGITVLIDQNQLTMECFCHTTFWVSTSDPKYLSCKFI
eukprot:TCONS_00010310-protein